MAVTGRREAQDVLAAGDAFWRAVLDSTSAQVAALDRQGRILAANDAWRRHSLENPAAAGNPALPAGIGTDLLEACRSAGSADAGQALAALIGILSVLQGQADGFSLECPCDTPSGRRWFAMNVAPLAAGGGGAVVTYVDVTDTRQAQAFREEATGRLTALARERLETWNEERRAVSRELHDRLFQSLTALKLNLAVETRRRDPAEPLRPIVDGVVRVLDELMATTGDLARRLHPPMLDEFGLASAVGSHLEHLSASPGPQLSLQDDIGPGRFPPAVELACFRVVEEAVDNALRHARAAAVRVTLRQDAGRLEASIRDDGVGFDLDGLLAACAGHGPRGLADMRERVAERGGRFHVASRPGAGTEITASFALSRDP